MGGLTISQGKRISNHAKSSSIPEIETQLQGTPKLWPVALPNARRTCNDGSFLQRKVEMGRPSSVIPTKDKSRDHFE